MVRVRGRQTPRAAHGEGRAGTMLGRCTEADAGGTCRTGPKMWRSARAARRRDRAGQPGTTEGEVDDTCSLGGPRSASGTEAVGTNCCR